MEHRDWLVNNRVDAVILNTKANAGSALKSWKQFIHTQEAIQLGFDRASVFNLADVNKKEDLELETTNWIAKQVAEGQKNFAAVGGDGTVHLAINCLNNFVDKEVVLGAVGLGSSNDFHKPRQAPHRYKISNFPCRLNYANSFLHDLGEVELTFSSQNTRTELFVINASVGLTAQANFYFNQPNFLFSKLKKYFVNMAIIYAAVRELFLFKPILVKLGYNDTILERLHLYNLGIVKNPHFAGDFKYDSEYAPSNGLFWLHFFGMKDEVLTLNQISKIDLLKTFVSLLKGRFTNLPNTLTVECSKVVVSQKSSSFALELDGEVYLVTKACFTNLKRQMLICP